MRVYVVGATRWCGPSTVTMFLENGYEVVGDEILRDKEALSKVDMVVFTGGSDVSPHLYGEENYASHCDLARDEFELSVFYSLSPEQAKVGICRGLQLLNVLNGGKLIQDHGHLGGTRKVYRGENGWSGNGLSIGDVIVCHHQGVLPPETGIDPTSITRIKVDNYRKAVSEDNWPIYSGFYPETNSFGVQWHPEWGDIDSDSQIIFFDMIDKYLGLRNSKKVAA